MKATITLIAALLVSACSLNTARAQYPVMPVGHGAPVTGTVAGGCSTCGGGSGGCSSGHRPSLYTKLFRRDGDCGNGGCGNGGKCLSWLCRPNPSNAPSCFRADYPLGFPNSPYVRSPRDYFMHDQYGPYGQFGY